MARTTSEVNMKCEKFQSCVPANVYFFKFNNRNPSKRSEIFSKLTITPERRSDVVIVNLEYILHLFSACLLLTLNK